MGLETIAAETGELQLVCKHLHYSQSSHFRLQFLSARRFTPPPAQEKIMHWVIMLAWGWLTFGVITVIVGLLWTGALSEKNLPETAKAAQNRRVGFAAAEYSKVHSA